MMSGILGHRSFGGGFRFRGFAGQPAPTVETLPVPDRVVIPLQQGFGVPVRPLVQPGEMVAAGQIIGRDDASLSSPIHATINGRVTAITQIACDGRCVEAVAIAGDRTDSWVRLEGYSGNWESLSAERIEELLYCAGVTGLARDGLPTRFHSAAITSDAVRHVIVCQVGADVFSPAAGAVLSARNRQQFGTGVAILKRALPRAQFHIAFSRTDRGTAELLSQLFAGESGVSLLALEPRYPQEASELLVSTVLKQEFPFGFSAANIGVVVMDFQTVLATHDAVIEGRPVLERTVALSGPGFSEPGHVTVRVGTPIERIIERRTKDEPGRTKLVLNSLLSGPAVEDWSLPLDRTAVQLVAVPDDDRRLPFAFARPGMHAESFSRSFVPAWLPVKKVASTNRHGDERPCVQCGWCARVCPVRIIPQLTYRQARVGINETLVRYGVFNCIDCNLCSFVCPSKIPLSRHIKETKEKLLEVGCDNSSCIVPKFDLTGLEEYKGVKGTR